MQSTENTYWVLLYYCYTPIENPELFREEHHQRCLDLDLRGRIIVSHEGLNGIVSGTPEACQAYMDHVNSDPRFKGIDFKIDYSQEHAFQRLNVRFKPEIVHSGLLDIDPTQGTGTHLEPAEFREMMNDEDVVIVDMRSRYEHEMGHFKGAVTLDIDHFRHMPEKLEELEKFKDKKVITYCTGGVKCEKGSAYLQEKGFENVYQLHGGIIKYGLEMGGENFDGKCYVFDNRVAVDVNTVNPTVVSKCFVCGTTSDHMVNCANATCNRHTVICEDCMVKMEGCCSHECKDSPDKRPYNIEGYYAKEMNGYNPKKCSKRLKAEEKEA